jgi:CubicO group peptidase (beta-lactamase class C family)
MRIAQPRSSLPNRDARVWETMAWKWAIAVMLCACTQGDGRQGGVGPLSVGSDADVSSSDEGDGGSTAIGETSAASSDAGEEAGEEAGELPNACAEGRWPEPDWTSGDPASHGFDVAKLEEAVAWAQSNESHCLLVVRDGELVLERYFGDADATTPMKSWSIAKSHVSAIVGVALERGDLGALDDSIAEYLPELAGDPREQVTLRHLLSMTAGLYDGVIGDMAGMFTATDMTAKAMDTALVSDPGSAWEYSNVAVQMFEPIFRRTGTPADAYARQHVWEPIGMDATWMLDPAGNPALFMNVIATCRDHARFGYLMLRRGCWDGEQVVPSAWIDEASRASQDMNDGYGHYFWRGAGEPTLDLVDSQPLDRGALHPGAPEDSFCAVGLGGQFIEVVPSLDLVVVRLGHAAVEDLENSTFPLPEIIELLGEGEQSVHDEIVQRVFASIVRR